MSRREEGSRGSGNVQVHGHAPGLQPPLARRWRASRGWPRHITLSEARSRLDQRRFLRPNTHFSAFFKIYKIITFSPANFANLCNFFSKIWQIFQKKFRINLFSKVSKCCQNFAKILQKILQKFAKFAREKMIFL